MNLSLATLNTIERLECKGAEMRAIICGALLALTITTANAAEQDVNSAEFMLPYCRLDMNEMLSGRSAPTTTNESAYLGGVCAGMVHACQSASNFDPRSASNFDPLERRVRAVALAPSELVGVAETARARVGE